MIRTVAAVLIALSLPAAEPLVRNGTLEQADPADAGQPLGWGRIDGLGVRWLAAPAGGAGKALRFDTSVSERDMVASWRKQGIDEWDVPNPSPGPIGATYGLSLYSDPIAIEADTPYRVAVRHRGPGGGKIWVRGYLRIDGKPRRIYEFQTEVGSSPAWIATSGVFHPTRHTPKVTEVRIMLYAYWPAGESWFDAVELRPATPAEWAAGGGPASAAAKR